MSLLNTKIVRVRKELYEEACQICDTEGLTIGDAITYIQLRRHQAKNPQPKAETKRLFVKLESGAKIALKGQNYGN